MAVVVSTHARNFVNGLNVKFKDYGVFAVMPGKRYDKITVTPSNSNQTFVHAFVEAETGYVFKPQGWKSPAKGVRFTSIQEALASADRFGGYLYAR